MVNEAQSYQEFKSLNQRDILNFPLHVPMGIDVITFLEDTFNKYYNLLKHVGRLYEEETSDINTDNIRKLGNNLIDALKRFRDGNIVKAYQCIYEALNGEGYENLPKWTMESCKKYYRMRKDKDITRRSEFYPLPPELRHLSGGVRFSIPGYSCFYIGQSEKVCIKEINDSGSIIEIELKMPQMETKNKEEIQLLDLTFSKDQKDGGKKEKLFISSWPLIAACYIEQFYCLLGKRVCRPKDVKFNERYVIPQLLTTYIRENHPDIQGIRYYTVKDVDLDPFGEGKKDMRNIVLYVDSSSNRCYDEFIDKFDWGKPYSI